jgi:transcriptional regulator with XRE-family HTH domain
MLFGTRLRMLREEKEITQKQLGSIINVSDRVIGYYESNNRFPRDENILKKLADFFDCTIDYLVGKSDIRNPYETNNKLELTNKRYYILDKSCLPEEALKQIEDYIEFIKQKYGSIQK